jgi:hypothetical protein
MYQRVRLCANLLWFDLGGTVLKTNVDLERAKLIQSTLAAPSQTSKSDDKS